MSLRVSFLRRPFPAKAIFPLPSLASPRSFFSTSCVCRQEAAKPSADDGLQVRLKEELKASMRAKDAFKSTVIRSILSEIQYAEKSASNKAVFFSSILQKAVARRLDSASIFRSSVPPREDLAEKEERETEVIKSFLPEQMSESVLEEVVRGVIEEMGGIDTVRGMKGGVGRVIKEVNAKVDKAQAPGQLVSKVVKGTLEGN